MTRLAEAVAAWPPEELLRMLRDPRYEPPPLGLKPEIPSDLATSRIEVRRVAQADGHAYIEKRYLRSFSQRARHEANLLDLVARLPDVAHHVVGTAGQMQLANQQTTLTMRWHGLSLADWHALLGSDSPLHRSCLAQLALVRAVLQATQAFHARGFVHADLLLHNLVCPQLYTNTSDVWQLNLSALRIIDLEFSLPPLQPVQDTSGRSVSIRREWARDNYGQLVWLHPAAHSPHLLPGPLVRDRSGQLSPKDLGVLGHDAEQRLQRVDWGADFFSLAVWLQALIDKASFVDDDDHPAAIRLLEGLPERLRAWDRLPDPAAGEDVPRPTIAHEALIREINAVVSPHISELRCLDFRLPTSQVARDQRNATDLSLSVLPRPPADSTITPVTVASNAKHLSPSRWSASGPWLWGVFVAVIAFAATGVGSLDVVLRTLRKQHEQPAQEPAANIPSSADATPASRPPASLTPAQRLEALEARLTPASFGSGTWLQIWPEMLALLRDPAMPAQQRQAIWSTLQTTYLRETIAITATPWWTREPAEAPAAGERQRAWLMGTEALSSAGLWAAAVYQARAVASGRPGAVGATDESLRVQAQQTLGALVARPQPGLPGLLPDTSALRTVRNESARLLFNQAFYAAGLARRTGQPVPTQPAAALLTVLRALDAQGEATAQLMLGYAALCLQAAADPVLARASYERASQTNASDDLSRQAAAEARSELAALQTNAAQPTARCQ